MKGDVSLSAPGHPQWLPLSLASEGDVDEASAAIVDRLVGDVASPDFRDETVAMVAGMSRIMRRQAEQRRQDQVLSYAAWMLMASPGLLLPGPVATLCLRPLAPTDSDDDVIGAATDLGADRHGDVDVDVIETRAGRALSVRYRPVKEVDGLRVVDEHRVVLWPRRDAEMTLELSLYTTDLVEGGLAAEPLLELAHSIDWEVE